MHSHVCDVPAVSKVEEFESRQGGKTLHAKVRDGCAFSQVKAGERVQAGQRLYAEVRHGGAFPHIDTQGVSPGLLTETP